VLLVLVLVGATLAAVALIAWAVRHAWRAFRSLGRTAGDCLGEIHDRASFLSTLGTPADWSRPGEARP
jgi:hypothetical protein